MAQEAFVCPHCRTWVEGSGRVVRCSSCGKRFRASEARLGSRSSPTQPSTPDERLFETPEWDVDHERGAGAPAWGLPKTADDPHSPARTSYDVEPDERWPDDGPERPTSEPERESSGLNIGLIFTVAILVLIFVGPRVLSGELVLLGFVLLVAAQWLVRRRGS